MPVYVKMIKNKRGWAKKGDIGIVSEENIETTLDPTMKDKILVKVAWLRFPKIVFVHDKKDLEVIPEDSVSLNPNMSFKLSKSGIHS